MSKHLAAAAEDLADLLARENEVLRRLDLPEASALVPAKEAAIKELTEALPMPMTPALAALGQRLRDLAAENHGLLERAIKVQGRVIEIVAGAYKPPPGMMRYGRRGEQTVPAVSGVAISTRA